MPPAYDVNAEFSELLPPSVFIAPATAIPLAKIYFNKLTCVELENFNLIAEIGQPTDEYPK